VNPPTQVRLPSNSTLKRGVRVTLTHTGRPPDTEKLRSVEKTWARMLANWQRVLESGHLAGSTRVTYRLIGLFAFALPKRMRNEYVAPEPLE
jgi:hypothetical protein